MPLLGGDGSGDAALSCLWFILRPLLQEGQAHKAECREGDAAKSICPVKEQQIDCIPHGHPCKEYRIRFDPSDRLHDRCDTEGTDPAQIRAEEIQRQLLDNSREQNAKRVKQRFPILAAPP